MLKKVIPAVLVLALVSALVLPVSAATDSYNVSIYDMKGEILLHNFVVSYAVPDVCTFTIGSVVYSFDEGMTWAQWCTSVYNTGGFYVNAYSTISGSSGSLDRVLAPVDNYPVYDTDIIISGAEYSYGSHGGGSNDVPDTGGPSASYDLPRAGDSASTASAGSPNATIAVLKTGLKLTMPNGSTQNYTYPAAENGTERILGLSKVPNQSNPDYDVGEQIQVSAEISLYLVTELVTAIEQEKEQANDSGNSAIDEMAGALPNKSGEFIDALTNFAKSFSYEGTSAELTIPALVLPGVDGLFPDTTIMAERKLDFGEYVQMLPDSLLLLGQSLLTIALIVFCFKELYDTISYVLTLRKGD